MFYQTDPKLMFKADSDCYTFCVLKTYEIVSGYKFSREDVMKLRAISVRADFIDDEGYINERGISGLAMVASGLTKKHVYLKRVFSADFANFYIGRFMRDIPGGEPYSHFVLMNSAKKDQVLWDPWSAYGARTVREGELKDYRFIVAEAI